MEEPSLDNNDEVPSSQTSVNPKKESRGLHGPSLGIGAGIAIVSILSAFFAINMIDVNPELQFVGNSPDAQVERNPPTPTAKPPTTVDGLALFTANGSPYLGNPDAPITLVEFGDYQCHFCNKFFHETESLIVKNYVETGKVKIIFKDFTIIGPDSIGAAQGAHCAEDQGMFWEYHDELYNNYSGENDGWAASENLVTYANNIGLDQEQFVECMSSQKYRQLVDNSSNDARNLGITGTPAFFVISSDNQITRIPGAQPYEVFHNLFEAELQK